MVEINLKDYYYWYITDEFVEFSDEVAVLRAGKRYGAVYRRRMKRNYEAQHDHTSVDAPATVYHVRERFRRLELAGVKCTINYPVYKGIPVNMRTLIPQKLMLLTRTVRHCCAVLKEQGGTGRMITTGALHAAS